MIEEFFKSYQYTVAAIAALGTAGAVVTSLWLAWSAKRADRTRLEAKADIWFIFDKTIDVKDAPRFLQVSITNQGRWPLRIPANFFYWKVPFKRGVMAIPGPLDLASSPSIAKKSYPIVLGPRMSDHFTIQDLPMFKREVKRCAPILLLTGCAFASSGRMCGRMTARRSG
jgi:hypothetical protein